LALSGLTLARGAAWAAQDDLPDPATGDPTRGLDPAGRLTVQVFLNDKGPFPFLVDTGANASVISSELASSLGLPAGRAVNLHGIAGVELVGTVGVASVRVGRRERRDLSLSIIPGRYLKAPGVLGMDWLGAQGLTLDFADRQMHVGARIPRADQRSVSVPVRLQRSGLSLIDAHVGSTRALTFLDTGSTTTVGNSALLAAATQAGAVTRDWTDIQLISLTGQTLSGRLAALKQLTLGKMVMRNVPVVFGPVHTFEYWGLVAEPALLIGVDVLRAFQTVTLDYHRGAVHFRLPDASVARNAAAS
jgi:predicted aspartyl protease